MFFATVARKYVLSWVRANERKREGGIFFWGGVVAREALPIGQMPVASTKKRAMNLKSELFFCIRRIYFLVALVSVSVILRGNA